MNEITTRMLIKKAQNGDESARNTLIENHRRFVVHLAKQFQRPGLFIEADDLIQQGCLGLLDAIAKFDLKRNGPDGKIRFLTYAGIRITHAMYREIDKHARTIAVPIHVLAYLRHEAKGDISLPELAKRLNISQNRLNSLPFAGLTVVPLEIKSEDDEYVERYLPETVLNSGDDPEALFFDCRRPEDLLRNLLGNLSERERFVIERHYGIFTTQPAQTLKEISEALKVCPDRIRQLKQRALARLRDKVRDLGQPIDQRRSPKESVIPPKSPLGKRLRVTALFAFAQDVNTP